MESIKFRDCMKIANIDAPQLSTDVKRFVDSNSFTYYVACNVWCSLAYDLSSRSRDILCDQLLHHGLVATIKELDICSQYILQGNADVMTPLGKALCEELDVQQSLQLLRFAKRFTPSDADLLVDKTISTFKNVLNEVKMKSRSEIPFWIIQNLREIVAPICAGFTAQDLVYDGCFTPGAVVNSNKSVAAKFNDWWYPYFLDAMYPLDSRNPVWCPEFPDYDVRTHTSAPLEIDRKTAKLITVPKSYKTYRTIAPEDSTRQWMLTAIRRRLERCIQNNGYSSFIPLEDQGINQLRSYNGSIMQELATVDLSAASDRLSYSLFASIFPQEVVNAVREWRSSKIAIGNRVYCTHMCATMGSAVCFVIESITFYSIAALATQIVEALTGDVCIPPTSYGDDITVDCKAYDTLIYLLETCGMVVNVEKSYTSPAPYRESCGVEFWNGIECTTLYYPRKPLTNPRVTKDLTVVESLIALHNRLYPVSWNSHVFLKKVLRDIIPDSFFTTSTYDDVVERDVTDLLDPINATKHVVESYGDSSGRECDAHMVIMSQPHGKPDICEFLDMYYYVDYLRNGPLYMDELDALLHVSTSRVKADDRYSKIRTYYSLKADI